MSEEEKKAQQPEETKTKEVKSPEESNGATADVSSNKLDSTSKATAVSYTHLTLPTKA